MYPNGITIVALTKHGVLTAQKIQVALTALDLNSTVYVPEKYLCDGVIPIPENQKLSQFLKEIYPKTDAIVAVMAAGIIIRKVAPLLQSKLVDPAVVCVDVGGRFAVSLLSGHYGGANELTQLIATGINATPVITTASDSLGKQSVDDIARKLHLTIVNPKSLVAVNTALVNEQNMAAVIIGDAKIPSGAIKGYNIEHAKTAKQAKQIMNSYDAGFIVTDDPDSAFEAGFVVPVTVLKPRRIVVGLGARKEITPSQVIDAITVALERAGLSLNRVNGLVTVDVKRDSKSMIDAAEQLGFTLEFVSLDAVSDFSHPELSPDSKIVQKNFGVGGVCEQTALITAGKQTHLILKKIKHNGVTVAIAAGT